MLQRINVIDEYTFSIAGEDHTIMNPLQWAISQDKDVELCGYTIPHPSENISTMRIQFKNEKLQKKEEMKNKLISGCDKLENILNELTKQLESGR